MTTPARKYRHGEAFNLMTYVADDGSGDSETVWNSRDGVTPFVITLRNGKTAHHHDWSADQRMPEDWIPPPGMRCFTDLTPGRARQLATAAVDTWLRDGYAAHITGTFGTRDDAIEGLTASYLQPGAPDLLEPPREPS